MNPSDSPRPAAESASPNSAPGTPGPAPSSAATPPPSVVRAELRRGAYHDSVVLLGLQRGLAARPGVLEAAVVMATPGNLELLASLGLLPDSFAAARSEDLVVAVRGTTDQVAGDALAAVDGLLAASRGGGTGASAAGGAGDAYRPHTLATALALQPATTWVTVSVPGRFAGAVAREALAADRHVFLFSDNVPVTDEIELKRLAAARGRLLLGPDCGTAIVDGVGIGFANQVPRGPVGIVAASGTGAQFVASGLAAAGVGLSHLLGTGGRDLSREVGGATALAALGHLAADPATAVLVLIGKPPAPEVAQRLLAAARQSAKPTVIALLGYAAPVARLGNLHFARGLDEAVALTVALVEAAQAAPAGGDLPATTAATSAATTSAAAASAAAAAHPQHLRGLFAGGTLAEETLLALRPLLSPLAANVALPGILPLADPLRSSGHTVLDLGDDAFTVGRLHPMLDPTLRLQRLAAEAADPTVAVILLDVVLGHGADADPAATLAPAIAAAREVAAGAGRTLTVGVLLVGTAADPQNLDAQRSRLAAAGAQVVATIAELAAIALAALPIVASAAPKTVAPATVAVVDPQRADARGSSSPAGIDTPGDVPTAPTAAIAPLVAVNVGLGSFAATLRSQGVPTVDLDWRPPAGGDARAAGLLARLGGAGRQPAGG